MLDAVAELDYEPDVRAQALRSGATKRIGLLIPDNTNPFYWQRIVGIEQAAHRQDYDILLSTMSLSNEQEAYSLKALASRRVDGIIGTLAFIEESDNLLDLIAEQRLPIVLLQATDREIDSVTVDYEHGMEEVMSHLLALGHQRIGLIYGLGGQSPSLDGGRFKTYCESLRKAGLPIDENLVDHCGTTVEDGFQAARRLLSGILRPTALVALNDLLAMGAIQAASEIGLNIPDDVSIVGFDDIPLAKAFTPPLTTVRNDANQAGQVAVDLLLRRLREPESPIQKKLLPVQLVIRRSTGSAAVD